MRCSPRRRSPTARSLTHRPPSRLTSRVWKRLQRRSRWSGPPQTAPPQGSTDAGDEADDEAVAAASGGGEATQRHNTLLTIGREAGVTGRRGEHGRHASVLSPLARAPRCRQAGGTVSFREPRPDARRLDGRAPRHDADQSQTRRATRRGGTFHRGLPTQPLTTRINGEGGAIPAQPAAIQTEGGGDWLSRAGERKLRCDRQKSCDWQAEGPASYFH